MARCGVTVRNILNLSRNDPGEQTTCQLNQIVSRVCDVLSPYADQRRTTIRPQFADGLPPIFANPLEIEILLINLARNAIESKDEEAQVTIRTSGGDGRVHLSVSDDGCGMTAEEIKRIFEPCYTTRQDSGGTGIGMSIVERILQNHGASIAIDSTPGDGTTIRIDFPAHSAPT
jgi:signal transduction histidine kinase